MDTFEMLQELLEQDQFELLFTEGEDKIRLVYLMNDAVESFLIFRGAKMTGEYQEDYVGELSASLSQTDDQYVLAVRQGDSVVTIFFEELELDVHLYNYGVIGHFWVKEYEYLRQLEYRLAILRDKYDYLGEAFCTPMERKLSALANFPPLNYCCYPSVSKKYIIPRENPWIPSEEAILLMDEIADEVHDSNMKKALCFYRKNPIPLIAKRIARMLHRNKHAELVDTLIEKLRKSTADYPHRSFGAEEDRKNKLLIKKAEERQASLQKQGKESVIVQEEPFTIAMDSVKFQVYLMVWKKGLINRKVEVEKIVL